MIKSGKLLYRKNNTLVFANGEMYKQVPIDGIIAKGALHSLKNGALCPLMHDSSIGKTPAHFSPYGERLFFNPMSAAERKEFQKTFKKTFDKDSEDLRRKRLMKHYRD